MYNQQNNTDLSTFGCKYQEQKVSTSPFDFRINNKRVKRARGAGVAAKILRSNNGINRML